MAHPRPDAHRQRQDGAALLLLLAACGLMSLVFIGRAAAAKILSTQSSAQTTMALAQARQALIAYALTYADNHPGEVPGYLPLPDMGGAVDNLNNRKEGWAASSFSGNGKGVSLVGRLPWYTLRLHPLRDEYGECLWYAVSGSFKQNPKADFMNWDSPGYLDLWDENGHSLSGSGVHDHPVAVIFSAGPPLAGQDRRTSSDPDDAVGQCGGNYDARNYLDLDGQSGLSNRFPGSLHDGIDSGTDRLKTLLAGPLSQSVAQNLNDRAVFITPKDIFDAVVARRDFADFINNTVIPGALACVPTPSAAARKGKLTEVCATHPANNPSAKWWDQFFFLVCASGSVCLKVNGAPCQAALIFAGARNATQVRTGNGRSDPTNYLEDTLAAFQAFNGASTGLVGATNYTGKPASQDVLQCVY